jgi:hypothetical protein
MAFTNAVFMYVDPANDGGIKISLITSCAKASGVFTGFW